MAMLDREKDIIAAAVQGANSAWLFEGCDTLRWLDIAENYRRRNRVHDADDAYLISARLQGLDNNEVSG